MGHQPNLSKSYVKGNQWGDYVSLLQSVSLGFYLKPVDMTALR